MGAVEFNSERMQSAASSGHMNAFAAATYLTRKGVPFRIAHEQVGKAVRLALDQQCELEQLSLNQLQNIDSHFDDDFFQFVKLENVLAIHDVCGGTAPARVGQALAASRKKLVSVREEAHAHA
jgi:argininosuccinate lyase